GARRSTSREPSRSDPMPEPDSSRIYFRQLFAGRDFGRANPVAGQMANFVYLLGDRETKECLVVDPAWEVAGMVTAPETDGRTATGDLVTHYHPDHIGGDLFGIEIEGLPQLLALRGMKIHAHRAEAEGIKLVTGISDSDMTLHEGSDVVRIGGVAITLV